MLNSEELWKLIEGKANLPGTWKYKWWFTTSFSDEYVFVVINESWWWYKVRIVLFDKPQGWGHGGLQIFEVSEYPTLSRAESKAEEVKGELIRIDTTSHNNFYLPILGFLKSGEFYGDIGGFIEPATYSHHLTIRTDQADSYLRTFDILQVARYKGIFFHVAVYLGKGYVCHFSGEKMGSSGSEGMRVKKDTLRNFFDGKTESMVKVVRPIINFKKGARITRDIINAIASQYGRGSYDTNKNNCEHFANLMVLGIRYSEQGGGLQYFTDRSSPLVLPTEIMLANNWCERNLTHTSDTPRIGEEIRNLIDEGKKASYGNWEARVEVKRFDGLGNGCKIQ